MYIYTGYGKTKCGGYAVGRGAKGWVALVKMLVLFVSRCCVVRFFSRKETLRDAYVSTDTGEGYCRGMRAPEVACTRRANGQCDCCWAVGDTAVGLRHGVCVYIACDWSAGRGTCTCCTFLVTSSYDKLLSQVITSDSSGRRQSQTSGLRARLSTKRRLQLGEYCYCRFFLSFTHKRCQNRPKTLPQGLGREGFGAAPRLLLPQPRTAGGR